MSDGRILVTVIGGYLGAGKTTVLNRVLREAPTGTAILVNDFGSVDVDGGVIQSQASGRPVVALPNGCICCSITDSFADALEDIATFVPRPSRLVIEASGVSQPGKVAAYASLPGFELDRVVVIVDSKEIRSLSRDKYVSDVVVDQLADADLLVLNKVDLVDDDELRALEAWVSGLIPSSTRIAAARHGQVPLDVLLGPGGRPAAQDPPAGPQRRSPGEGHVHPGDEEIAEEIFETWSLVTDELFDEAGLRALLEEMPVSVARIKGIVRTTDAPSLRTVIQRAGARTDVRVADAFQPGDGRVVVIAYRGTLDSDELERRFRRTMA